MAVSIRAIGVVAVLAVSPAPVHAQFDSTYWRLIAHDAHVRAAEPAVRAALRDGLWRSGTLRELVQRLQQSNVIVYLDFDPLLPYGLDGRLRFMASGGGMRYVRIGLRASNRPHRLIAVIGHELHHAVEVADAAEVTDARALAVLFERIGFARARHERYETAAAMRAAEQVGADLRAELEPDVTVAGRAR